MEPKIYHRLNDSIHAARMHISILVETLDSDINLETLDEDGQDEIKELRRGSEELYSLIKQFQKDVRFHAVNNKIV